MSGHLRTAEPLRTRSERPGGVADRRIVTLAERPELAGAVPLVLAADWPTFMVAGRPGHDADLTGLLAAAPQYQVLLLGAADEVLGVGLSVPLDWDRTAGGLPAGWDGAVAAGADSVARGGVPEAVCALAVTMTPAATGQGTAAGMVAALKAVAARAGAAALIAPVRPILKARYPLTPMHRYLSWRTADGRVFDPWLRLHLDLGALQVGIAFPSMTITGSVADWQGWTGLDLPASGEYVIPAGLVPLAVDLAADTAAYREPNVWMVHRAER